MREPGRTISVEYTLTLDDGTIAETNVGEQPLVFRQGTQEVLPAFDRRVAGMGVNESREFILSPEEGYGPVRPELRQEIDADLVPGPSRREGAQLVAEEKSGTQHFARVHEVRDDTVVLDLNHPLAGENLHFRVKVLRIG